MTQPACKKAPPKDPARQWQGAASKQLGEAFERRIDAALERYELRGEALVMKTPEPMRATKDLGGGRFVAHHEKKAQPDYKGVLKGGRAIVFEAKCTATGRMEQGRVTPEQEKALNGFSALGAECFVVVGFGLRDIYKVPWADWRGMKDRWGRKHVVPGDLGEHRVRPGPGGLPLILD